MVDPSIPACVASTKAPIAYKRAPKLKNQPVREKCLREQGLKREPSSLKQQSFIISTRLNTRYSFSNFVVGNSNQFCHAAARQVAEDPGKSYNPLFIYGGVGLGKTHLLHAIGNAILENDPSSRIIYMSSETFTNELISALRRGKMDEFKEALRNISALLIDDIQFISGKERTQEEFFHTFNELYNSKRQIVVTSDTIPHEIKGLEDRLKTRFSWGLIADLQAPDFETRVAILNRKAALDSIQLPMDVAQYIAENFPSNVRELEGALTRLNAAASLQHVAITIKLAESVLRPMIRPKQVDVTVDLIKTVVARHFGLKISDLSSKKRSRSYSFPRHIAMYLCRKYTTCSYPEIGQEFGGRDHSSVIHAANVVTKKLKFDKGIQETIKQLEEVLLSL
ncbi:MAG: chromosomal replication initiator protein DnaA [Candidatus Dadabacteria bacterium]|nr:MAG: chromosomal replication initiator protein DnaA [Candidatus Dadabacteria bacterium]